jgi:hypothetical protein
MAIIAPAFLQVNPSYTEPGVLLPYTQASGAFEILAGGEPLVRLSDGDLFVYMSAINLRTKVAAGEVAYNQLPSCSIELHKISTKTYLLRVRSEYDHHDAAAAGRWGVSIAQAYTLAMMQGHFQLARSALLFGMNPALGEGMLNANGATSINLPADTNGNSTVVTYDNGQMAFFLLGQIAAIKSRTNQLGIGKKFVILMPQRVGAAFEYNVVQLVQFQRVGAGTTSTAGVVKNVLGENEDEIVWVYDDTLIGQGAGGNDAVIITMPEVSKPQGMRLNTNEFARLAPGIEACNLMYSDMAAPREITAPLAGGAVDIFSEWRVSSGWPIRPEATTILSIQYQ